MTLQIELEEGSVGWTDVVGQKSVERSRWTLHLTMRHFAGSGNPGARPPTLLASADHAHPRNPWLSHGYGMKGQPRHTHDEILESLGTRGLRLNQVELGGREYGMDHLCPRTYVRPTINDGPRRVAETPHQEKRL